MTHTHLVRDNQPASQKTKKEDRPTSSIFFGFRRLLVKFDTSCLSRWAAIPPNVSVTHTARREPVGLAENHENHTVKGNLQEK